MAGVTAKWERARTALCLFRRQNNRPLSPGRYPSSLRNPSEFCSEMARKWLSDRSHPKGVAKNVALNDELTFNRLHLLGGSRAGNAGRRQPDRGVLKGAFCDFHDSVWVSNDEFDPTWGRHPPKALLPMEETTIVSMPTDLAVGEERLTDMRNIDGLLIIKGIDCRIFAVAGPDQIPSRTARGSTSGLGGAVTIRAWHSRRGCAEACPRTIDTG